MVDSRLKLSSITSGFNGVYTCRAENTAGIAQPYESYLLNVRGLYTTSVVQDFV